MLNHPTRVITVRSDPYPVVAINREDLDDEHNGQHIALDVANDLVESRSDGGIYLVHLHIPQKSGQVNFYGVKMTS